MEGVTLTQKEQTRLGVLNSVLADQVPVCQAAEVLGVSERHMRRIPSPLTGLTQKSSVDGQSRGIVYDFTHRPATALRNLSAAVS